MRELKSVTTGAIMATLGWVLPAAAGDDLKDRDDGSGSRSVVVEFCNLTDQDLTLTRHKLPQGTWLTTPADEIVDCDHWEAESEQFGGGTEGAVDYFLDAEGRVRVLWDNLFVGGNSYTAHAPKAFELARDGGEGKHARIRFVLQPAATADPAGRAIGDVECDAARCVHTRLCNATDLELSLTKSELDEGLWLEVPPAAIAPAGCGDWVSESDDDKDFSGTSGLAAYNIGDLGALQVTWDNPDVGSNSYGHSASRGFAVSVQGGSGDDAHVLFTVGLAP